MGFQVKPALENAVKDWRNDQLIQETRGDKKDKREHNVGFFFSLETLWALLWNVKYFPGDSIRIVLRQYPLALP